MERESERWRWRWRTENVTQVTLHVNKEGLQEEITSTDPNATTAEFYSILFQKCCERVEIQTRLPLSLVFSHFSRSATHLTVLCAVFLCARKPHSQSC